MFRALMAAAVVDFYNQINLLVSGGGGGDGGGGGADGVDSMAR